ncbi:hypothetical protein AgCh_000139 [Apium graveolens]
MKVFLEKGIIKAAASRTRSKQIVTPVARSSQSVQSLSSELEDSPKSIKGNEMSTGHLYAKGDMLLPQSIEGLSAKSVDSIMSDATGYSFHVYNHDMKKLNELEDEHTKFASKIQAVEELDFNNLKAMKDVQNELEEFASKVQSLEKDMRDEAEKVVNQQIMRTRFDTMIEYYRGEWKTWDVLETVKIYNKEFPDDAFHLDEFNAPTDCIYKLYRAASYT